MFNFFKKEKVETDKLNPVSFEIELTAAVLAYEIARIDGEIRQEELDILMKEIKIISKKVGKVESEILRIIEVYSQDSVSFYDFVEDINKNYSKNQKLSLLGFMWDIAYADGVLDIDEERLIRRLAVMINVKDLDVLKLKDVSKN